MAQTDVQRSLAFLAPAAPPGGQTRRPPARNVIFFLGDGLGITTVRTHCDRELTSTVLYNTSSDTILNLNRIWMGAVTCIFARLRHRLDCRTCARVQLTAARALRAARRGRLVGEEELALDSFVHIGLAKARTSFAARCLLYCFRRSDYPLS